MSMGLQQPSSWAGQTVTSTVLLHLPRLVPPPVVPHFGTGGKPMALADTPVVGAVRVKVPHHEATHARMPALVRRRVLRKYIFRALNFCGFRLWGPPKTCGSTARLAIGLRSVDGGEGCVCS